MILCAITGYVLVESLKSKDQDILEVKFHEYSNLLERDGTSGLQLRVSSQSIPDANKYLVRLQSHSGKTLFLHVPETMEIVGWTISLNSLDQLLREKAYEESWIEIEGPKYGDDVEVFSKEVPEGILQIGKDTEDREELLKQFVHAFLIGLIPFVLISVVMGYVIAKKMLKPIRWLTDTVNEIRSGRSGSRVPVSGNKDELDQLGEVFNQMQDDSERLVQSMKDTLDHVAHDLRTPIMRMQNTAHFALEKMAREGIHAPLQNALVECQENSDTILKLLDAIMDISEIEAGTMTLRTEQIVLSELVNSVLDIYTFIAEEKEIKILNEVDKAVVVVGDKVKLLQALANLVDNAIKYSPDRSKVILSSDIVNKQVILNIVDEGVGIPEDEMLKIWSRLYRGDKSRSTKGLGLGLSLVKAIVSAHKAQIVVRNNLGSGCTFSITFSEIGEEV